LSATNGNETAETRVSLGESLKKRRLQRGLTFDMIGQDTRISQRFLKALEEEQWAEFPAKVYLEGFLRQYAAYLGFDGGEFVLKFREAHGEKEKPSLTPSHAAPKAVSTTTTAEGPSTRYGLAFFVLFAAGALGLYFLTRRTEEPSTEIVTAPVVASTSTVAAVPRERASGPPAVERPAASAPGERAAAPSGERPAAATASTGSHRFQVTAQGTVWMRAWVDGQVRFEGIVRPGTVKSWSGKESFRLEGANFGLLDVAVDGTTLRPTPEKPGEILWSAAQTQAAGAAAEVAPPRRRRAPSFVSPLPGADNTGPGPASRSETPSQP